MFYKQSRNKLFSTSSWFDNSVSSGLYQEYPQAMTFYIHLSGNYVKPFLCNQFKILVIIASWAFMLTVLHVLRLITNLRVFLMEFSVVKQHKLCKGKVKKKSNLCLYQPYTSGDWTLGAPSIFLTTLVNIPTKEKYSHRILLPSPYFTKDGDPEWSAMLVLCRNLTYGLIRGEKLFSHVCCISLFLSSFLNSSSVS